MLPGWFDHIRNLDTSLVVFLRGSCSGLGPSEGGIVYGLFSKEASYIGKASVKRTHCPGLAARLTEQSGVCIAQVPRMQANPGIDFSGADHGASVSFHWLFFPQSLKR